MKKSILVMSFFILSFLFSGCAGDEYSISIDTEQQLSNLLDIQQPKQKESCIKIPIYKEPKVRYCTKKMTLKECVVYQSKVSMNVRYQLRKQIKVCESINARNGYAE